MHRAKYALAAALAIALTIVAIQAYSMKPSATVQSTAFAPGPANGINYPNPISQNVTLPGVMTSAVVAPVCALSNPPCAISNSPLYYITVNGVNYRLIFSNSTKVPSNRSRILVTGVFVTPSTYPASQWTPQISFRGDIYVITYTYLSPYT